MPVVMRAWWSVTLLSSTLRVLRCAKSRIPALVANPGNGQDSFQQTGYAGHHVVRDIPASRSRVGNELLLVERLGDVQRLCRGQVEVHVAVLLKCRQVVEQRRLLQGFPALHLRNRRRRIGSETAVGGFCLLPVVKGRGMEEAAV